MRLTLAALLTATSLSPALAAEDEHSDHLSELDGVEVLHAWARATDGDEAFVYMEITNTRADEVMLVGGESEIAEEVHLMAIDYVSGGKMVELEELPIPAGGETVLSPEGVFLELHGLMNTLSEGDEFEMHVELAPLGEVEIHVEVEAADAENHSHAGHNH